MRLQAIISKSDGKIIRDRNGDRKQVADIILKEGGVPPMPVIELPREQKERKPQKPVPFHTDYPLIDILYTKADNLSVGYDIFNAKLVKGKNLYINAEDLINPQAVLSHLTQRGFCIKSLRIF